MKFLSHKVSPCISSKAKIVGADNYLPLSLIKEKIILSIKARYQALFFGFFF